MSRFASALFGATALVGLSAVPAMAQSAFDGPYVGVFTGYTDGGFDTTIGSTEQDVTVDGWNVGGFVGFGKSFGQLYLGAEGELGYNDTDGDATIGGIAATFEGDLTYGASLRAGFIATPELLLYGRVGYQYAEFDGTASLGAVSISDKVELDGVRYGLGAEYAFADNLLARVEYTYTDFEDIDFGTPGTPAQVEPDENVVRVGLAYRF